MVSRPVDGRRLRVRTPIRFLDKPLTTLPISFPCEPCRCCAVGPPNLRLIHLYLPLQQRSRTGSISHLHSTLGVCWVVVTLSFGLDGDKTRIFVTGVIVDCSNKILNNQLYCIEFSSIVRVNFRIYSISNILRKHVTACPAHLLPSPFAP